jgi:hypothetical protein
LANVSTAVAAESASHDSITVDEAEIRSQIAGLLCGTNRREQPRKNNL